MYRDQMSQKKDNVIDLAEQRRKNGGTLLERVFVEHSVPLRDYLRVRTGLGDEVEDIVQEVFMRLFQNSDLKNKLSSNTGSSRSYIFSIANHIVVDMHRRNVLQRNYANAEKLRSSPDSGPGPERINETNQQLAVVKQTLLQLKPRCREIFMLNRYKSMSYRQISDHVGLSVKQVEKYMSHALKKLRESAEKAEGRMS